MLTTLTTYKKPLTKEDEKEEFDALYQLLQSMVKPVDVDKVTVNEVIEPIKEEEPVVADSLKDIYLENESSTSPDVFEMYKHIHPTGTKTKKEPAIKKLPHEKRKYVRKNKPIVTTIDSQPQPSSFPPNPSCPYCLITFQQSTDYLNHLNTSTLCMNLLVQPLYCQPRHELTKPLHTMMGIWMSSALCDSAHPLTCRHCKTTFSTTSTLHKHLSTAPLCNRMAYIEFKKIVSDF